MWRGGGRQGFNTMSIIVWERENLSLKATKDSVLAYLTKVSEKPALLSLTIIRHCLSTLASSGRLTDKKTISLWSDCGTHYRSWLIVSACAYEIPKDYNCGVSLSWGCEQHFKNAVDTYFSVLSHRKTAAAKVGEIYNLQDLIKVYTKGAELSSAYESEQFFDFMPPEKAKASPEFITRSSAGGIGIRSCHNYTFTLHDARRKHLLGKGWRLNEVTGVFARAHIVPHWRADELRCCHPILDLKMADQPADEEALLAAESAEAPVSDGAHCHETTHINGWKMYYRKTVPEDLVVKSDAICRRLMFKQKGLQWIDARLPLASRVSNDPWRARRVAPACAAVPAAVPAAAPAAAPAAVGLPVHEAAPAAPPTEPVLVFGAACSSVC